MLKAVLPEAPDEAVDRLDALTPDYSAAAYAALRSQLKALATLSNQPLDLDAIADAVNDHLPADIGDARRYQTLQALVNCTRRSLLPDPDVDEMTREAWRHELRRLEAQLD